MKNIFSKIKGWWTSHGPTKRRLIQLYSALLFNSYLKGYITGDIFKGITKNVCTPGLNCYSCPGAVTSCPLGALQNAFSASKNTAPYYMLGIIMLFGIIFGRWICGWLCPFGLIQDLLHKIKTPKLKKSRFTRVLSFLKYVILVLFVVVIPLIYMTKDTPLPAFCKYICPAGTIGGAIGLLINPNNSDAFEMLGPLFTWKFVLAVSIVVAAIFIYRIFCRFICPLGAIYGLFNKISFFGIKLEKDKCISCGKCISVCKMDIHHVGDIECINCGECIPSCPTKAISYKGAKIILPNSELEAAKTDEERVAVESKRAHRKKLVTRITALVLSLVLVGSLIYFNFIHKNPAPPEAAQGSSVGDKCFEADLEIINGEGTVNVKDFRGKVVIVNFWGTWCTPCVNELPHFDQVAGEYADDVVVIAVHSVQSNSTAKEYVDKNYPNTNIIFAYDQKYIEGLDMYYSYLGGTEFYPRTVILDEDGVITFTTNKDLTHEQLVEQVENAKSNWLEKQ